MNVLASSWKKEAPWCQLWKVSHHQFSNPELSKAPDVFIKFALKRWGRQIKDSKQAHQAGVKIATGTDSVMEGILHHFPEVELMVEALDMSPMDAPICATKNGAEFMGLIGKKIGTLQPGKYADLVLMQENPLENIKNIRTLKHVLREGEIVASPTPDDPRGRLDTVGKQAIQAAGFIDLRQSEVNFHENEFLLIEDKRISGFLTKGELPDDCELLDFSHIYALPGLVDASFLPHLMFSDKGSNPSNYGQFVWTARQTAKHWFKTGVTTAATLGAVDDLDKDLGDCINQGKFLGPRNWRLL